MMVRSTGLLPRSGSLTRIGLPLADENVIRIGSFPDNSGIVITGGSLTATRPTEMVFTTSGET